MKVAVVITFPRNPRQPHGGVEAVAVNLIPGLARLPELEIHVVSTHSDTTDLQEETWEGASIHRLPARPQKMLSYATGEGRRQVQAYLHQLAPDVVHAHDTYGIMVQGLKLPRVFTIHGFIHEDTRYGGSASARLRSLLWKRVETAAWREQPHIISISPYVRERLRGIASGSIHDIENPIASECFDLLATLEKPIIFSAAMVCERKNTLGLIRAFHLLRQKGIPARLRLAGRITEPAYGQAIQDYLQEHHLTGEVDLLGAVSADQVRSELAGAAVFALVSFEEGAPMGLAEAMAAGLPVVTSNRCGMPYMVRHGETGFLVDPNDPEDVAAAFRALLTEASIRNQMGQQARRDAADRYHPDRVAERTLAVYRRAIARFQR